MTDVKFTAEQGSGSQVSLGGWGSKPQPSPQYKRNLLEATKLFSRAMKGDPYAMLNLREAFSTSDFPYLFGDILSRELLPEYQAAPAIWPTFARRTVVRDFRPHKFVDLMGGRGLLDIVPELTEYPARELSDAEYELTVRKQGARFALSWESMVNDDLGGLQGLPNRLALSARRSEDYLATSMLTDGDGPNDAFFSAENDNLDTAVLSTDNLAAMLTAIQSRRDEDDAPIIIDGFVLVVPPALEQTAQNILGAREIRITDEQGNLVVVGNWLSGRVTLSVNPWLPVIDQGANASTTWYVVPVPSSPRPALVVGFLRGNETPDLRVRSSDSRRVGGGDVPAEEGSFDNDDIQYRVRHVNGSTTLDFMGTMASIGTTPEPAPEA